MEINYCNREIERRHVSQSHHPSNIELYAVNVLKRDEVEVCFFFIEKFHQISIKSIVCLVCDENCSSIHAIVQNLKLVVY